MVIAKIEVNGIEATLLSCSTIPQGIVGATVEITYCDKIWDSLRKTVVLKGCCSKDIITDAQSVIIPADVVANSGAELLVGIYGSNMDGSLVVPTLWVRIGRIFPATKPSGDTLTDPSYSTWATEIENRIASLEDGSAGSVHTSYNEDNGELSIVGSQITYNEVTGALII